MMIKVIYQSQTKIVLAVFKLEDGVVSYPPYCSELEGTIEQVLTEAVTLGIDGNAILELCNESGIDLNDSNLIEKQ